MKYGSFNNVERYVGRSIGPVPPPKNQQDVPEKILKSQNFQKLDSKYLYIFI